MKTVTERRLPVRIPEGRRRWAEEEAEEETFAYEQALSEYRALAQEHGWSEVVVPKSLAPKRGCELLDFDDDD